MPTAGTPARRAPGRGPIPTRVPCRSMPSVPRLPLIPDPLRRIHVPRDLKAITTVGDGGGSRAAVGLSERTVERIWASARELYRSGVHPAVQLCLRRHGQVVLDRAIGHARGNGPDDPRDAPKVPGTPDTPYCVFSTSKGDHGDGRAPAAERGALDIARPCRRLHPGVRASTARARRRSPTCSPTAPASRPSPAQLLDLDRVNDREFLTRAICDAKPFVKPGTLLAYHAVSGGFILGEIVHRVTGKTIREVLAEEILDPLGFRWGNYGVSDRGRRAGRAQLRDRPPVLPPLSTLVTRVLSQTDRQGRGAVQRPSLPHLGDRPERQPDHDRRTSSRGSSRSSAPAASSTASGSCSPRRSAAP